MAPVYGRPILDRHFLYAGGREMPDYGDLTRKTVTRNITPDPDDGIAKWTDAQIKRAITAGIRPDGSRLNKRCVTTGTPGSLLLT